MWEFLIGIGVVFWLYKIFTYKKPPGSKIHPPPEPAPQSSISDRSPIGMDSYVQRTVTTRETGANPNPHETRHTTDQQGWLRGGFHNEDERHRKSSGISRSILEENKPPPNLLDLPSIAQERDMQDKDAWDQEALDLYMSGDRKPLANLHLRLDFLDLEGKFTTREVESIAFSFDQERRSGVLWAFCHLRKANRPFRYSGIKRVLDLSTGELITDLGPFLQHLYDKTPHGVASKFLTVNSAAIYCVYCIAKADGFLREKERDVLQQLIKALGMREQEPLEMLMEQIRTEWVPSQHKPYWDAVKEVARRSDSATLTPELLERMKQVIATDKKSHDDEVTLLNYAAKVWKLKLPN